MGKPLLIAAASMTLFAGAGSAHAQGSRGTDARLFPLLGCWNSDSTGGTASNRTGALTCVVPVSGSPDVDVVSIANGRVTSRHRIDASTRAHAIDGQGCKGQERTSWSSPAHRVYLHAEFVCAPNGAAGGATTLYSFLPNGEWLEVESIRSGGGSIVRAERYRDAGVPNNLPREIASQVGTQRLAVMTARAEAAAPIQPGDVVEALKSTDSAVTRLWLIETAQPMQISGDQMASLVRANVPAPVLQAMMSAPPRYQLGNGVDANGYSSNGYLSTPSPAPLVAYNLDPLPSVLVENVYLYDCCAPVYPAPVYYNPYSMSVPVPYGYPGRYYPRGPSYPYRPLPPTRPVVTRPSYLSNPVGIRPNQVNATSPHSGTGGRRR